MISASVDVVVGLMDKFDAWEDVVVYLTDVIIE